MRLLLSVVLAILSCTSALATYGYHDVDDGNMRFTLGIVGLGTQSGHLISGTKVETLLLVYATTPPGGGGGSGPVYESFEMTDPTYTIGGTAMPVFEGAPEGDPYNCAVRIASTNFAHDSTLTCSATVTVWGVHKDGAGNIIGYGPAHNLSVTVTPKIYNVGKTWGTRVTAGNVDLYTQGVDLDTEPWVLSAPGQAKLGTKRFYDILSGVKHQLPSTDHPLFHLNTSTPSIRLQDRLVVGTFIRADTHGNDLGLAHSFSTGIISWAELKGFVTHSFNGTPRSVPLPNLVVAYACSTLASGYPDAAKAFAIYEGTPPTLRPGTAYLGFELAVVSHTKQNGAVISRISEHAKYQYEKLSQGDRVESALDYANDQQLLYTVENLDVEDGAEAPMSVDGDSYTRLVKVYLSPIEDLNAPRSITWYFVY